MRLFVFWIAAQAFAAGPPLPWPGQNPPGYSGPPQLQAAPAQGAPILPVQNPVPQQNNMQDNQANQALEQLFKQLMGGKSRDPKNPFWEQYGGADLSNGYESKYGFKPQTPTDGKMEPCSMPPPRVLAALEESRRFRNSCPEAQRGDGQRLVINDFSSTSRNDTPYMYIFDLNGECLGKTAVTYGNGLGPVIPEPCSDGGCHLTPPGFHLTAYHNSDSYPSDKSLAMVSLEGQGSNARGVLIHPAARPGTASSWGCAGVGSFDTVKRTLGEGALVYNFFGDKGRASGCSSSAGLDHSRGCRLETPQRAIPQTATGVGTPAMK